MKWVFTTIIGAFLTTEKYDILTHLPYKTTDNPKKRKEITANLLKKNPDAKEASQEHHLQFISKLKEKKYFALFREQDLVLTTKAVREAVNQDVLLSHAVKNMEELDKSASLLIKRLREWYELYLPEFSRSTQNHEAFVHIILEKSKKQLAEELNLNEEDSMGAPLAKEDVNEMMLLAQLLDNTYKLRERHLVYLDLILKRYTPNMHVLCGTTITAKLLERAGGLKKIALLPSSTVQLLGAEKALFRHLTQGSRSPKHGLIHEHPLIQKARKQDRGKVARALAERISMASRLDYFKGEFKGLEYKKELEERFK